MLGRTKIGLNEFKNRFVTNAVGGQSLEDIGVIVNPKTFRIHVLNMGPNDLWMDIRTEGADESGYYMPAFTGSTVEDSFQEFKKLKFFVRSGQTAKLNVHQEGGWTDA